MSKPDDIYRQRSGIVAREIVDEFILVPVSSDLSAMHSFFTLNSVGRFIWERLDGNNDLNTIAAAVEQSYEIDPDTAHKDLYQLIGELNQAGLITQVTPGEVS